MAWYSLLTGPIEAIIGGFTDNAKRKDELKAAKHNAEVERVKRGDVIERDYDLQALKNAQSSWIDEIMVLWVLAVISCLFIPTLAPVAIAGIAALAQMPYWFQLVVVGCFISKLGLRFLFNKKASNILGK